MFNMEERKYKVALSYRMVRKSWLSRCPKICEWNTSAACFCIFCNIPLRAYFRFPIFPFPSDSVQA